MKRFILWLIFLPVQFVILLTFVLAEVLHRLKNLFSRQPQCVGVPDSRACSIVILNWNGRHLLEECLPALVQAVKPDSEAHQILVVDNGSTDDSVAWTRQHFPSVDLLELDQNYGFVEGNNRGVRAARNDIVVLLNNDMIVEPDFLAPLLDGFDQPGVFAVTSQIHFPPDQRREETGNTQGSFRKGFLHLSHDPIQPYHYTRKTLPVLWAGGGSTAFRKDLFLQLGGFSQLFSPCYFEDTDLSYRAWRRGWKVLLAADSQVLHKHRSSSSVRFKQDELDALVEKRRLWYLWKNFQLGTLLPHFLLFPLNLTKWLSPGVYLRALLRLPSVLWLRISEPRREIDDKRLMQWVSQPISYLNEVFPDRVEQSRRPGEPLRVLILSAYLPHLGTHGGAGRVFQLLKRAAQKHPITLLAFVEDEKDERFLGQPMKHCKRVETVLRRYFKPVSLFPFEPFEEFNCDSFREALAALLAEVDFDVVHFEWTQMAMFSDLFPQIPKIITEIEVNYAAQRTLIGVESNPLKRLKLYYNTLQTLYREVEECRKVEAVVCVTDEDRDYLKGYLPAERLKVINTGVDTRYFDFRPEGSDPDAIVFVGAFRHSPNVDAMRYFSRQVFPKILDDRPETHLYIVGSSPPTEIKSLGEHPNVTVTGFVEDIRDYYQLARVVIVPLRTGVGIRGKILEGWSAGRAMVATSLACQGIRAIHGETIMIADTPEEFALWTVALLNDPEFCIRLGHAGRQVAEKHYEWDILGQQVIDLYEELVSDDAFDRNRNSNRVEGLNQRQTIQAG